MANPAPDKKMVTLTINGKELTVPQGTALIQACEQAGAQIPRFCYHERLLIAGNCRKYEALWSQQAAPYEADVSSLCFFVTIRNVLGKCHFFPCKPMHTAS